MSSYLRDTTLVAEAFLLIWAARRGLTETELLEMLGEDGQRLPRAYWSPLYLAAEDSFINRGGLIGFSHEYFRKAVADRYLSTETLKRAAHGRIAAYFAKQPLRTLLCGEEEAHFGMSGETTCASSRRKPGRRITCAIMSDCGICWPTLSSLR